MRPHRNADILRLQEHLVTPGSAFTVCTRGLCSTKRLAQVSYVLAVDETHAGLDRVRNQMSTSNALGPDLPGQHIGNIVGVSSSGLLIVNRYTARVRAESFILGVP